jgi:hypothetical protein
LLIQGSGINRLVVRREGGLYLIRHALSDPIWPAGRPFQKSWV